MFGSSKSSEEKNTNSSAATPLPSGAVNTLVKGTLAEGTIKCESDLRVDGTIKGKLDCAAKLIIGPSGLVDGEVRCQSAVIEGAFRGVLRVKDLLNVRENAKIDGDIFTDRLIVQSGAKFNVACKMQSGMVEDVSQKNQLPKTPAANVPAAK